MSSSSRVPTVEVRLGRIAGTAADHVAAQREALGVLNQLVPFDAGVFSTVDPATVLWTSCVVEGLDRDPEREAFMFENEYRRHDLHKIASLARSSRSAARLSAVTPDARERSPRYRMMRSVGVGDELRCALVQGGACWGSLELYRAVDAPTFTDADLRALASLSGTLARLVRVALLRAAASRPNALDDPPGVVVLANDAGLEAVTPAGRRWLVDIGEDERLPPSLLALAMRLSSEDRECISMSVPRRSGGWLRLHATRLQEGPRQKTSIVLEPAMPVDLPVTVARAYGFTPRESEVVTLLARGASAKEIARQLGISTFTAEDHVKTAYRKAKVRSRPQLIAALFFEHYLPFRHRDARPGPYGGFLGEGTDDALEGHVAAEA